MVGWGLGGLGGLEVWVGNNIKRLFSVLYSAACPTTHVNVYC